MKKIMLFFLLAGLIPACTFAEPAVVKKLAEGDKFLVLDGIPSSSDLTALEAADATKVDKADGTATNLTLAVAAKFPAVAGGTNYIAEVKWDATNKVFTVTETAE